MSQKSSLNKRHCGQLGDLSLLGTDSDTFETYANAWLKDGEANRKASTFYGFNLKLHLIPTLKSQPIGSITRADCRKVLAECRKKSYGSDRSMACSER